MAIFRCVIFAAVPIIHQLIKSAGHERTWIELYNSSLTADMRFEFNTNENNKEGTKGRNCNENTNNTHHNSGIQNQNQNMESDGMLRFCLVVVEMSHESAIDGNNIRCKMGIK